MEVVGAFGVVDQAEDCARQLGGRLLVDPREDTGHLPFAALVSSSNEHLTGLIQQADVAAFVCVRRVIKPRVNAPESRPDLPGKIAVFPMVRRGDLTHDDADRHWRDEHAPLALSIHKAMSFYTQLSIVHVIHGPAWDGIALCGFDTLDDLRTKFYDSKAGQKAIETDVRRFADPAKSPRRLICNEYWYG